MEGLATSSRPAAPSTGSAAAVPPPKKSLHTKYLRGIDGDIDKWLSEASASPADTEKGVADEVVAESMKAKLFELTKELAETNWMFEDFGAQSK
jgi:hypothetical protein